jgi:hypothetical protein
MLTFGITRWCPLQRVMTAKLTRRTHKVAIQLHLVAESCTICVLAPGGQSGNFWTQPVSFTLSVAGLRAGAFSSHS